MISSRVDKSVVFGPAAIVVLLLVNAGLSYKNVRQLNEDARWVAHTHEVMDTLEGFHGVLREAEAVEQTFLVTGGDMIPSAFTENLDSARRKIGQVRVLTEDNRDQQVRLPGVEKRIDELERAWSQTMKVRTEHGLDAARQLVIAGQSRKTMAEVQELIRRMEDAERSLLSVRQLKTDRTYSSAVATGIVTALSGLVAIAMFIWLLDRHMWSRQRAAELIPDQRELLHATLTSVGDAVITTDTEGRVRFLNQVGQQLTGWTQDEAAGQPLDVVFRIVNHETRQPVENPALRALKEGAIVGLANHTLLISRDGTERPIDDSAAPIRNEGGALAGAVMVFRDVSQRLRQERELEDRERQFHTLAESIPQLAWMANPDGHIFW